MKELIFEYSGLKMKEKTSFEHSGFNMFSSAEALYDILGILHPWFCMLLEFFNSSVRNLEISKWHCTNSLCYLTLGKIEV